MLLTNLQSLQVVLASAVATTQPVLYAGWADHTTTAFTPNSATSATNSTTAVSWVAAPAAGAMRQIKNLSLYNADSAAVTATVRVNDNGTNRTIRVVTLLPGEALEYADTTGWRVAAAAVSATPADYISGLRMVYGGPGSITVESGAAYIQGLGRRVDVAAAITKSGLALAASTWYHAYLLVAGGVPDVEVSTTAPAAAYNGTARSKSGDPSRRYIGSVLTDSAGSIYGFTHVASSIIYTNMSQAAPFRVVAGGVATVPTTFSCAGIIPVSARGVNVNCTNNDTAAYTAIDYPGGGIQVFAARNAITFMQASVNASQQLAYHMTGSPAVGATFIDIVGYTFER